MSIASCPASGHHEEKPQSLFFVASYNLIIHKNNFPLDPLLLHAEQSQFSVTVIWISSSSVKNTSCRDNRPLK